MLINANPAALAASSHRPATASTPEANRNKPPTAPARDDQNPSSIPSGVQQHEEIDEGRNEHPFPTRQEFKQRHHGYQVQTVTHGFLDQCLEHAGSQSDVGIHEQEIFRLRCRPSLDSLLKGPELARPTWRQGVCHDHAQSLFRSQVSSHPTRDLGSAVGAGIVHQPNVEPATVVL